MNESGKDIISVCISTYKRPEMLNKTMNGISSQVTESSFSFEMVVVDNDVNRSAEETVRFFQQGNAIKVTYDCEPVQSISLARNRAIKNASGNLIAFIDDDEFPERYWLINLYKMHKELNSDGVLGPVIPHFDDEPPKWIVEGKLWDRLRLKSGTAIQDSKYTRTGNVLLSKSILEGDREPFDPAFGKTGGGDIEFFRRKMKKGYIFVWCDEAIVYETVPPERQTRSYLLKRAFTRGMTNAKFEPFLSLGTGKSIIAVALYSSALPVFLISGHHIFMEYLIKDCDHISKLLAYLKFNFVKKRPY